MLATFVENVYFTWPSKTLSFCVTDSETCIDISSVGTMPVD